MKGIINIGNSCYLNSAIQLLFNSKDFRYICKQTVFENIINNYDKSNVFNPYEIKTIVAKKNKMFDNCDQHDSYEFIIYLFDVLDNILGYSNRLTKENLLYNKFGIETKSNIKCKISHCGKESDNNSIELFLQLPITDDLDLSGSYRKYKEICKLENDNAYFCEKCNKKVTARKNTITTKWPDNLIIVLKRFDFIMRKDGRNIYIPLNWRHGYKLKGGIIHMGTFGGGHYIYFGEENQEWFIANDSHISKINDINSFMEHQGKQSYILYYQKHENDEYIKTTSL